MDGWQRRYRLGAGSGGLGLSCTGEGLALAGVPLLAKGAGGFQARPAAEVAVLLRRAYAGAAPDAQFDVPLGATVLPGLAKIADALNRGDLVQAMIRAVHLRLPELDWDAAVRLAQANDNLAKYSPDQPRDDHGRWTDAGGAGEEAAGPIEEKPKQEGTAAPVKPTARPKQKKDAPKQAAPHYATAADFVLPASPAAAPLSFQFSPAFDQQSQTFWEQSLAPLRNANGAPPPKGQKEWVVEQGATIVATKDGALEFQNIGGLPRPASEKNREFLPDLKIKDPENYTLVGTIHTHPYDSRLTGVSFSGGDTETVMDYNINMSFLQSGEKQFLFLKTKQTPKAFNAKDIIKYQDERVHNLMKENKEMTEERASSIANYEAARDNNLAYYEGNHGKLYRNYPPSGY
ncbi:MAG: hypothetical protein PW843_01205 [Azospirillaceae bacterium]|nr:hypothetical protein [Azospirillaceae bacterium]